MDASDIFFVCIGMFWRFGGASRASCLAFAVDINMVRIIYITY